MKDASELLRSEMMTVAGVIIARMRREQFRTTEVAPVRLLRELHLYASLLTVLIASNDFYHWIKSEDHPSAHVSGEFASSRSPQSTL